MRGSRPGITAGLLCAVAVRAEGARKETALTRGSGLAARGRRRARGAERTGLGCGHWLVGSGAQWGRGRALVGRSVGEASWAAGVTVGRGGKCGPGCLGWRWRLDRPAGFWVLGFGPCGGTTQNY